MTEVDQDMIIQHITATFPGTEVLHPTDGSGAGDTFFYAAAQRDADPAHRLPFATLVTKDYAGWDERSQLDRPDVFRLNIGISRATFIKLFNHPPTAEATQSASHDFSALDHLMPHPTYAPQGWVCILNPSPQTFESVKPLLSEAHALVTARHSAKAGTRP